jgi:hypothetical protein
MVEFPTVKLAAGRRPSERGRSKIARYTKKMAGRRTRTAESY